MDAPELSRPDLFAHREALHLPASKIVEKLVEIVERKLTSYIGGVKDARAVDRWRRDLWRCGDATAVCIPSGARLERARFACRRAGLADGREPGTGR
jgi:hypothetical protein